MNPLESWTEEQRSAFLYRACAQAESGTVRAELFRRLAGEAEAQAAIWRAQLTARGHPAPGPFVPDTRTKLVARMVHWLGPRRLRNVLAAMKVRGMSIYGTSDRPGARPRPPMKRRRDGAHRHRGLGGGGNLQAGVFGVNDGLVSNASLAPRRVAGATNDPHVVVPDRRRRHGRGRARDGGRRIRFGEIPARALRIPDRARARRAAAIHPEAEAQELALIYAAKGPAAACRPDRLAQRLVADPEHALDTLAREEARPQSRGARLTAQRSAASSFVAFPGLGALLPLAPWLLARPPAGVRARDRGHRRCAVRHRRDAFPVHRAQCPVLRGRACSRWARSLAR